MVPQSSRSEIDVSLIVCSRNRCEQLARCLETAAHIRFERSWELIVVDNGSFDETFSVVRDFSRSGNVVTRYVFEPNQGLGNGHNAGLEAARGTLLAFTDDDCYPADDFLAQVWAAFADPSIGYIGGRIMLHDPADYPATINESVSPRTFPGRSFVPAGAVQGANMAFRRKVLLDIGGFDPLFGPGALFVAEDVDVVSRASAIGWKGQYRPEVVVRHHHGRKASDIPRLAKSYAIGRGAYYMKLLLRERQLLWFAQAVCGFPRRFRWETRALWEVVGAAKYAWFCFARIFRNRTRSV